MNTQDNSWGSRCLHGGLDSMELHLSLPSSNGGGGHGSGMSQTEFVHGKSFFNCSLVESSAMVSTTPMVMPSSSSSQQPLTEGLQVPSVGDILRLSRMEFLQACLRSKYPPRLQRTCYRVHGLPLSASTSRHGKLSSYS